MAAYAGHAGRARFLARSRDAAGLLVTSTFDGGISAWQLRVSVESTGLLLVNTGYGPRTNSVPLLREVFVGAQSADLTVAGHVDDQENPFEDVRDWLVPEAGGVNSARFELRFDESDELTEIACAGRVLAIELTSSVRGVVGFTLRAALDELLL